jgi:hypothetical protein
MDDKQQIEKHIAKLFLERMGSIDLEADSLICGDPLKNEPDILYADKGLEIGAVLRGMNTHIDNYEREFLSKVSEAVEGSLIARR